MQRWTQSTIRSSSLARLVLGKPLLLLVLLAITLPTCTVKQQASREPLVIRCLRNLERLTCRSYFFKGIETTLVYWPVKLKKSGKVLFFRLQLWDCGENALRRFDHLLPVSTKKHSTETDPCCHTALVHLKKKNPLFFSPARSRWMLFFSSSPSLIEHRLMTCQIRLPSGPRGLGGTLSNWWLAPSILLCV